MVSSKYAIGVLLGAVLFLTNCAPAATPIPDLAATRVIEQAVAATLTAIAPTSTTMPFPPTAIATQPPMPLLEITTAAGTYFISEIQTSNFSRSGEKAKENHEFIIIRVAAKANARPLNQPDIVEFVAQGVITTEDNSQMDIAISWDGGPEFTRFWIQAMPKIGEKGLTLLLPNNPPIPLGR